MQKFLKALERNVEWVGLGLGGLFLLWMLWTYGIGQPASVKIGTNVLYPDNVEEEIYNTEGKKLNTEMSRADKPDMSINDVLTPYLAKLDEKDAKEPQLAIQWGGTRGELPGVGEGTVLVTNHVTQLPTLPPPTFVNESHEITTIMVDNPNGNANGGGAGGAIAQPVMNTKDTNWISLAYKVSMPEVGKAYKDAFKTMDMDLLFVTRFLQVELIREEKLPNGQWSQPTTLPSQVGDLAYPGDVPQARQAAAEYKSAIGSLQKQVLTPAFPKIMEGAPAWFAPGQQAPAPGKAPAAGAPNPPAVAPVRPANPNAGVNGGPAGQLAAGDINVLQANDEKNIIVHDLTVEDGKTYRYALRYKLSNPVWDSSNLAAPELTKQFALVSPQSEWTKEITVPSHTRLFVTNVNGSAGRVTFKLFEYKNGKFEQKKVDGTPGDSIKDWTVVDVRKDSKDSYALVLESGDKLTKHTKRSDQEGLDQFEAQNSPRQAALAK